MVCSCLCLCSCLGTHDSIVVATVAQRSKDCGFESAPDCYVVTAFSKLLNSTATLYWCGLRITNLTLNSNLFIYLFIYSCHKMSLYYYYVLIYSTMKTKYLLFIKHNNMLPKIVLLGYSSFICIFYFLLCVINQDILIFFMADEFGCVLVCCYSVCCYLICS
jgi:hypothetical protein